MELDGAEGACTKIPVGVEETNERFEVLRGFDASEGDVGGILSFLGLEAELLCFFGDGGLQRSQGIGSLGNADPDDSWPSLVGEDAESTNGNVEGVMGGGDPTESGFDRLYQVSPRVAEELKGDVGVAGLDPANIRSGGLQVSLNFSESRLDLVGNLDGDEGSYGFHFCHLLVLFLRQLPDFHGRGHRGAYSSLGDWRRAFSAPAREGLLPSAAFRRHSLIMFRAAWDARYRTHSLSPRKLNFLATVFFPSEMAM